METVFLACFVFGALFTLVSVLLGAVSHAPGADVGHFGHLGNAHHGHGLQRNFLLPLLNASSILAFLTWFGAAGFLLLRFGAWSIPIVLAAALLAGFIAATLIALFLRKILAGERVMNPADYRLQGTLARVTVTIPAGGVGEVVFSKAGTRRSEAARSETGEAIPRGTEVVILSHEHGVTAVQPWRQLLGRDLADHPVPPADNTPALPSHASH